MLVSSVRSIRSSELAVNCESCCEVSRHAVQSTGAGYGAKLFSVVTPVLVRKESEVSQIISQFGLAVRR